MNIHRPSAAFAAVVLALAAGAQTAAAQTATQVVSYEVQAINEISVSGSPTLVVSAATAGSQPESASASGSYAVTSNETGMKVTAELGTALPAGLTLTTTLDAPTGASSAGEVILSTSAQDVVTGISQVAESGLGVTYGLTATVAAGVVPAANVNVTYTLTAGI